MLHVVFLLGGIQWLKEALNEWDASLITASQRVLEHFITAAYMLSIAFSIILLILAVFVLEIFRTQRRMYRILTALEGFAEAEGDGEAEGETPGPGDSPLQPGHQPSGG